MFRNVRLCLRVIPICTLQTKEGCNQTTAVRWRPTSKVPFTTSHLHVLDVLSSANGISAVLEPSKRRVD